MAFKQNTIKLDARTIPPLNPKSACLKATPGKVWVELLPAKEEIGGFILPDVVGQKYRANVGVVISAGDSRTGESWNAPSRYLRPGDGVLVRPYDGEWFDDFEVGGFKAASRVVCYGLHATPPLEDVINLAHGKTPNVGKNEDAETWVINWWESVVAAIVGTSIYPTGDNVLIQRKRKEYAIEVPNAGFLEDEVEIIAWGPFVELDQGPAVVKYAPEDLLDFDFSDVDGLAIIPASAVHAYA